MTLLFYYTLLIMFFYTIVAATSLSAFYVSHRRTFLYATFGFTFYFFDVSLVFKDNFITPDAVFEAASFYDVGHPYTSIITGGGAFLFLWLAACRYCREERPVVRFAPVALWAALSLAAYQFIENPQWREFVYYNLRAVLQLVCYGLLAWWYTHSPDPERRSIMKSHRTAFFWAIGLTCGIILENVYVQLIFDPGSIPRGMWGPRRAQPHGEPPVHLLRPSGSAGRVGVPAAASPRAARRRRSFARGVHRSSAAFV